MTKENQTHVGIAIIGVAGKFPGASNINKFWENLKNGVLSVTFYSDQELLDEGVPPEVVNHPSYVKASPVLDGVDEFDANFFGYTPKEAEMLDPQHRLFLEGAWEALENAGYLGKQTDYMVGVYTGVGFNHYSRFNLSRSQRVKESTSWSQYFFSNDKDFLSTRVSYLLNLEGPSINVQTACSSSLVAVHMACESIRNQECDMALAGGVSITVPQRQGYLHDKEGIASPDGHCRAFDENAQGTIFGSGLGIVVLKHIEDAIADNDTIWGVIKGSAINNDGSSKVGYTAPGIKGQTEVIANALTFAEIDPETISYVETHGTGTFLGDPVEIEALTSAYRLFTDEKEFCSIGSVKTNIGHLDTASGVTGLLKVLLSMKHEQLPPSLGFEKPNPRIDFANSPFSVNHQLTPWKRTDSPRRAAVSSFGIGGTNAHVIVEEPPQLPESDTLKAETVLIPLSAKTKTALEKTEENLCRYLKENPTANLADIAFTWQEGRKEFSHRNAIVCQNHEEAITRLEQKSASTFVDTNGSEPSVNFLFPGQGSQFINMGLDLYEKEPAFRKIMDDCFSRLPAPLNEKLPAIIFPKGVDPESAKKEIEQTQYTQPALFIIEYSIARFLIDQGVEPTAMMGHSVGEYVAACLSGVFSLDDALKLIAERGRLIQSLPEGSMLAVFLPVDQVKPWLNDRISLAAHNVEQQTVLSGPDDAIEALKQKLTAKGISAIVLQTSHAFHSVMMEPILDDFQKVVEGVTRNAPTIPFVSNVTGKWITDEEATDPAYWSRHIRAAVLFSDGLRTLLADDPSDPDRTRLLVEAGPGKTLTTFAKKYCDRSPQIRPVRTIRHIRESVSDSLFFYQALADLWNNGVNPDWTALRGEGAGKRIPLPTYPFEHQSYWVDVDQDLPQGSTAAEAVPTMPEVKEGVENWFYLPTWKKSFLSSSEKLATGNQRWLIFMDDQGLAERMTARLVQLEQTVVTVTAGEEWEQTGKRSFVVNPDTAEDYLRLFKTLKEAEMQPTHLAHCWNFTGILSEQGVKGYESMRQTGFDSLIALIQGWGRVGGQARLKMGVVSNQLQKVTGQETLNPNKSPLLGPCRVIPFEYTSVQCKSIDLDLKAEQSISEKENLSDLIEKLLLEINSDDKNNIIALRDQQRWVETFDTVPALDKQEENLPLQEGGVYMITGGLGGIALTLAKSIAESVPAKFALMGRSPFLPKEQWEQWLSDHSENDSTSIKIKNLQALEALGSEVEVFSADINNVEQTKQAVQKIHETWGALNGVIHAAGVPGESMIQFTTTDKLDQVLNPKTVGLYVLEEVLQNEKADFLILCSSVSAYMGGLGQVAYCSANAFLDSYAQSAQLPKETTVISINWPTWAEVGMAVNMRAATSLQKLGDVPAQETINHPLVHELLIDTPEKKIFASKLSPKKDWVLNEHRIQGKALIAGATYIEMVRAAFFTGEKKSNLEINDLFFLTPLILEEEENRTVYTLLIQENNGFSFRIASQMPAAENEEPQWVEHAKGSLTPTAEESETTNDLKAILDACSSDIDIKPEDVTAEWQRETPDQLITTGPRWQCVKEINVGDNEGLVLLELDEPFQNDTDEYRVHPSLMDIATSVASTYVAEGNYLPFFYKKVTLRKATPARIYSYIQYQGEEDSKETIRFDLKILDENGVELINVEGFTKKKVNEGQSFSADTQKKQVVNHRLNDFYQGLFGQKESQPNPTISAYEITPKEGAEGFQLILSQQIHTQLLLSPTNFNEVLEMFRNLDALGVSKEIEKTAVPEKLYPRPELKEAYVAPRSVAERRVAKVWREMLGFEKIGVNDNFFELGGDSLLAVTLINRINQELEVDISVVDLFDQPNIKALAQLPIFENLTEAAEPEPVAEFEQQQNRAESSPEVAIIGMSGRFPGAKDLDIFWENLRDGVDTLTYLPNDTPWGDHYVAKAQLLEDIEQFDASFFGYTAKDALVLSPQHRLFLEHSWEALESAGYDPKRYNGRVGVFAGAGNNNYIHNLLSDEQLLRTLAPYQLEVGNEMSYVSSAVAFRLNLKGPAVSIQTACSTSLVAIHNARLSLANGECEMALAGGVSIRVPQEVGYAYVEGGIYSNDGYVRTFDANAKGTIFSSGVGVVVLKRLSDAINDRDTVLAVIKGSAINNDGSQKAGFTAPSRSGQRSVILKAQADAGVKPDQIQYVETHGTATVIGDPIEVGALTQAFRTGTDRKQYCGLGSVKSNIGHTDTAAGVAGVIKMILAMKHETVPATLNFDTPNPAIDFQNSPFYVNNKLSDWKRGETPRIAGVSSFGVGGTNSHVILQEPPVIKGSESLKEWKMIPLSARSENALRQMSENLAGYLENNREINVADLSYTLQVGRQEFDYRQMFLCRDSQEAVELLRTATPSKVLTAQGKAENRPVILLFSEELEQTRVMGEALYQQVPEFRKELESCCDRLKALSGIDLLAALFAEKQEDDTKARLVLFVIEYALAKLLNGWGVTAAGVAGKGTGKVVAACMAGVVTLDDALSMIAENRSVPKVCNAATNQLLSSVDGNWIEVGETKAEAFWNDYFTQNENDSKLTETLLEDAETVLLEIGPNRNWIDQLKQQQQAETDIVMLSLLEAEDSLSEAALLRRLGQLWLSGVSINWNRFYEEEKRVRLSLPTYPFERQHYWVNRKEQQVVAAPEKAAVIETLPEEPIRKEIDQWFYEPSWKESALNAATNEKAAEATFLIFQDDQTLGEQLKVALTDRGCRVVTVKRGESFANLSEDLYQIGTTDKGEYQTLFDTLKENDTVPTHIAHLWNFTDENIHEDGDSLNEAILHGFVSLTSLVKAWKELKSTTPLQLNVVSNHFQKVTGEELLNPAKALIQGPCRVIPAEYRAVTCKSIDLDWNAAALSKTALQSLTGELLQKTKESMIAWRGENRWVESPEPVTTLANGQEEPVYKNGGVYLITGGLGGVGLAMAENINERVDNAKFALLGRSAFPAKEQWEAWLNDHNSGDKISKQIQKLIALEEKGAEVIVSSADITDLQSTKEAIAQVVEKYEKINGVIHAAGLPGADMIAFGTTETYKQVLAPKVEGTYVMEQALAGQSLDFMLLCSSIESFLGTYGQVAYCSGNAFLDAFAKSRFEKSAKRVVSVNWPAWKDVGMTALGAVEKSLSNNDKTTKEDQNNSTGGIHPLLERLVLRTPEKSVYTATFRPDKTWVLDEHRLGNLPLVPGVTYIEMARSAYQNENGEGAIELFDLFFLSPLLVADGEEREVYTFLIREKGEESFRIASKDGEQWIEHATGKIRPITDKAEQQDLPALMAKYQGEPIGLVDSMPKVGAFDEEQETPFLTFGPRWNNALQANIGEEDGMVQINLPEQFADDLNAYGLHPALLDNATSFGSGLVEEGNYLPFYYKRLKIYQSLPGEIYSRIQYNPEDKDQTEVVSFDIEVLDKAGTPLLQVERFVKKRVGETQALQGASGGFDFDALLKKESSNPMEALYQISPVEAGQVMDRALASGQYPHLLVSPVSLNWDPRQLEVKKVAKQSAQSLFPRPQMQEAYVEAENGIEQRLTQIWKNQLGFEEIGVNDNFFDLGGDSLMAVNLVALVNQEMGSDLTVMELFDYPTIKALAQYEGFDQQKALSPVQQAETVEASPEEKSLAVETGEMAIIGMSGKFSEAANLDQFWENLREAKDTLTDLADQFPEHADQPGVVAKAHQIPDIELFDAAFFKYSAKEATVMSPQHRLFMECSWQALEHAGYDPERYDGKIGVYAGSASNHYSYNLYANPEFFGGLGPYQYEVGNELSYISSSVSFKLNLTGSSLTVLTACSSSLVAIHHACQSLISGENNMALAGGVTVLVPQERPYRYYEGGMYSPDGYCRTFDENAQGTIFSSGVGAILLKPLELAEKERDTIYAVVKGTAINNDGSQKAGFTAPSRSKQKEVILEAQKSAGVTAEQVQYVETHGTATPIGDPIEMDALTQAFRTTTGRNQYCAVGSVKSNIGHTVGAAGVAGVIKTALAMHHEEIPATLHFEKPNPKIDFENSPFYVAARKTPWKASDKARIAAVSSFGVGGTNAHVVMGDAPKQQKEESDRPWHLLSLSAKSNVALQAMSDNLANHLEKEPDLSIADAAYTLSVGRQQFEHRKTVVCQSREEAIDLLRNENSSAQVVAGQAVGKNREVAFFFSGSTETPFVLEQGLYQQESYYRQHVDYCCFWLKENEGVNLKGEVLPTTEEYRLPALFVIEYATAQLLMSWGITPSALSGQGVGEYVAAVLAGIITLEEGLRLAAGCGKLLTDSGNDGWSQTLKTTRFKAPKVPFLASLSGAWVNDSEAVDASYWELQCQSASQETKTLKAALEASKAKSLEIAPLDEAELLGELADLQIAGASIDWNQFYREEQRYRIALPTYPFERQRYWVDPAETDQSDDDNLAVANFQMKKENPEDWFYLPTWKQETVTINEKTERKPENSDWLVFENGSEIDQKIIELLDEGENRVHKVRQGETFQKVSDQLYEINPTREEDYTALLQTLQQEERFPANMVHLWNLETDDCDSDSESYGKFQPIGFNSLYLLSRAFGFRGIENPVDLFVLSTQLLDVTGEERLSPAKSTLTGICNVMRQELQKVECRLLDITLPASGSMKEGQLLRNLKKELSVTSSEEVVAYRNNRRWIQDFDAIQPDQEAEEVVIRKENANYLITGGLGGLGLTFAEWITKQTKGNIFLLGRSAFPARDSWERWLAEHDAQDSISLKIQQIKTIEQSGATITPVKADVTNRDSLFEAIRQIEQDHRGIHGVIHAAGTLGENMIQSVSLDTALNTMASKTTGTMLLHEALETLKEKPDFMVLFSSTSSWLGGMGMAAYASANSFLNAFANKHSALSDQLIVATGWSYWDNLGMTAKEDSEDDTLSGAILPNEGGDALERVLAEGLFPQVVISPLNWEKHRQWVRAKFKKWKNQEKAEETETAEALYERPDLPTEYEAPKTEMEKQLAMIIQGTLRIAAVGINDNFFDLGIDSLTSLQMIQKMSEYNHKVSTQEFMEYSTIAELAKKLEEDQKAKQDDTETDIVVGDVPLLPNRYDFFRNQHESGTVEDLNHWNSIQLFEVDPIGFNKERMEKAVELLLRQHDGLRLRIVQSESKWSQHIVGMDAPLPFEFLDFSHLPKEERKSTIAKLIMKAQKELTLDKKPVNIVFYQTAPGEVGYLMMSLHHMLVDDLSIQIMVNDFFSLYGQLMQGETPRLPEKTMSLQEFAMEQDQYAQSDAIQEEFKFMKALPWENHKPMRIDYPEGLAQNTNASGEVLAFRMDQKSTEALKQKALDQQKTSMRKVVMTGLARAFARWNENDQVLLNIQGHGREKSFKHLDVGRTVGYFTEMNAMLFRVDQEQPFTEAISTIDGQFVEFQEKMRNDGLLRYVTRDPETRTAMDTIPEPEVGVNFLPELLADGKKDNFDFIRSPVFDEFTILDIWQNPNLDRRSLIYILVYVLGGELIVEFVYSRNIHKESTMQQLSDLLHEEIQGFMNE